MQLWVLQHRVEVNGQEICEDVNWTTIHHTLDQALKDPKTTHILLEIKKRPLDLEGKETWEEGP